MKNARIFLLLTILYILPTLSYSNGYEIKFQIKGLHDTAVILGHHYNSSLIPDDTVIVDKSGNGVFKGQEAYPGGMYFLFIKGAILNFFLDVDQTFYLESDTNNLEGNLTFKGCALNEAFEGYNNKVAQIYKKKEVLDNKRKNAGDDEKKKIDAELMDLGKEFNDLKWETIEANQDNFLGIFLKATEEIKVPDPPKDENGNITDSLFQYFYYINHFLDNFDVSDERLIRTPIYEKTIKRYMEKVVPQIPDTLIKECDKLIESVRHSDVLFKYMLPTLFNIFVKSEIMGMDAVYIHLAEKYYLNDPKVDWGSEKFIAELRENVEKQKPLLIGNVVPDFELVHVPSEHFKQAMADTTLRRNVYIGSKFKIHDLKADYIVLYFWESDCGHCKKSSPKLYEMVPRLKEMNTLVVSVHMMGGYEGKMQWVDFINTNKMYDWMNAWNPFSYDYKDKLDLKTTNQIYILDKDKKIIAKRISPEQVETVIKAYIEKEKKEK